MAAQPLTQTACDMALREALDAEIARRRPACRWTINIDREVWRASDVHKMGARSISKAMAGLYPWATRSAVETRLAELRRAGGPAGLWP